MEKRWKVLYFESDAAYAKIFKESLTLEGFDVVWKNRVPDDSIAFVVHEQPQVIVLDALLPGDDGFRVAARFKADLRLRHIPIVFLSSLSHSAEIRHGRDVGAADYVVKATTSPREVANRLKVVCGQPPQKSSPKVRVAHLPDIEPTPQQPRIAATPQPSRRWLWAAGLVVVIAVGVYLSFIFAQNNNVHTVAIPVEYLEPSACVSDDDCRIQPGCCSTNAVNLYHFINRGSYQCTQEECVGFNIGVACLNQRCVAVTALQATNEQIEYSPGGAATAEEERLWVYDCTNRHGEYNPCNTGCSADDAACIPTACRAVCELQNQDTLPFPGIR